jgi:LPS export ABC transporter protein LptC
MVWWFHLQNRATNKAQQQTKPQEYMAKLTITNFSVLGKPKENLTADYWAFVPSFGMSELKNPKVVLYKPNGDVWHLSANRAKAWHPTLGEKITQLDLMQGVLIERLSDNNATPTKITTNSMQYFPKDETLSSDDYVYMQQPGLLISGQGMSGYLNKNRIELHSNIKTVYTPNDS